MDLTNQMPIATKSSKIDITLEKNTKSISQELFKYLLKGDVICLKGEIGVGKTTFIKYLINNLQSKYKIKETEVPSPTFNLAYEYKIKEIQIKHYDLYRVKSKLDLINLGLFEEQLNTITFIEWPEILEDNIKNRIDLNFEYEENLEKRSLIISSIDRAEVVNAFK